jgi:hypothetical protein
MMKSEGKQHEKHQKEQVLNGFLSKRLGNP